jgi:hypothetical protein
MNAMAAHPANAHLGIPRRVRLDGPDRAEVTPESIVLGRWLSRQAALYSNVLATIAHAPRPVERQSAGAC